MSEAPESPESPERHDDGAAGAGTPPPPVGGRTPRRVRRDLGLRPETLARDLLVLAWPAVLEGLLQVSLFVVDLWMVGRLPGEVPVAAMGAARSMVFFIGATFMAGMAATQALVARHTGARHHDLARRAAGAGIHFAVITGGACLLAMWYWRDPLFEWFLSKSPETVPAARDYFIIVMFMFPARMIMVFGQSALRGAGDTFRPMLIMAVAVVLNLVFNWLLIFPHPSLDAFIVGTGLTDRPITGLGVRGAAWATAISFFIAAILTLVEMMRSHGVLGMSVRDLLRPGVEMMRTTVRLALPAIGERAVQQASFMTYFVIMALLGTTAIAAHTIGIHVESVVFLPAFGFSLAVATLVGQSLGAGKPDMAELTFTRAARWGIFGMMPAMVLLAVFSGPIVSFFIEDVEVGMFEFDAPGVGGLAASILALSVLEHIPMALFMALSGGVRGAGDTLSPILATLAGAWLCRVPLTWLFALHFDWGLVGVWGATGADWIVRTVVIWMIYRRGRWRTIQV